MPDNNYKRILIKFSGEVLAGEKLSGIDPKMVDQVAEEIFSLQKYKKEIALVFGGGNIFRGLSASEKDNTDRVTGDYMGMLATVINALAVQESLSRKGVKARVMSAIHMPEIAEPMIIRNADKFLHDGEIVIFSAGTGRPFFSTDTGAALRAAEIKADLLIKGTKVDGVYDKDPIRYPDAIFYPTLDYQTCIEKQLKVMDTTAFSLCQNNNIPIVICNMTVAGNIEKVIAGKNIGTLIVGGNNG
ncbi:MAG: UMP kinase [Candidatus Marinimicrobia bacterium]|nr:UMP kinase [Candidatus Neomarinimicrobiota bacterium]